jgi:hypothetical protein
VTAASSEAVKSLETRAVSETLQLRSTVQAETEKALETLKELAPSAELLQVQTTLASSGESQKSNPQ